jgi:hypothetical protein
MLMERVRLVLMVDEELREALRVESSMTGKDMSDIVADLLRDNLSDTLELLRSRRRGGEKKKPPRGQGRKPSSPDESESN